MFVAEAMATFMFCSVILSQKYRNNAPDTVKAFAVGATLTCAILAIMNISGACINPAVGLIQTIYQSTMFDSGKISVGLQIPGYGSLWIYVLGPLTGGILAGLLSKLDDKARGSAEESASYVDAKQNLV